MQIRAFGAGTNNISPLKYCGSISQVPQILTFDTKYLALTFESDSSVQRVGFKVMYKILTRKGLLFVIFIAIIYRCKWRILWNNMPLALQQALCDFWFKTI